VEKTVDASRISAAFAEATRTKQPVAVLVGNEYHGIK
jgi:hypothetical protein